MIRLTDPAVSFEFIRSSGPGGQNVNKVSTAVRLKFDLRNSSLPVRIKDRLIKLAGKKYRDGILTIHSQRFRTQQANRRDAVARLDQLLHKASQEPKVRKKTRPTLASKVRRLEIKNLHSRIKAERRAGLKADE